jgi:hypothetical protein
VIDEPCLHRLSYIVDPEADRDHGLVWGLIDLQRTINDCWNKSLEWKNRCLMPQAKATKGADVSTQSDTPGAVTYHNPGTEFEWQQTPQVPAELADMLERAISHMRLLAADSDIQAQADLAARTVQAVIEQDARRWQHFLGNLSEWHSRLMRHCLSLVQQHYSEPRRLQLRGRYGTDPYDGFMGAQLRGQVDVTVAPGSVETKSPQQLRADVEFLVNSFPGAITAEAAQAALNGGHAEKLIESYNLDVARAHKMIQRLREGPDAMLAFQPRLEAKLGVEVPGWMPREQDNPAVHRQVFADYMKTDEFDRLPPETQEMFNLYWGGIEWIQEQRAIADALKEQKIAAGLGAANAAKPQSGVQRPDQPSTSPAQAQPNGGPNAA